MKKLTLADLEPLENYVQRRPAAQASADRLRRLRHIQVGDRIDLDFENRETVRAKLMEYLVQTDAQTERSRLEALAQFNDLIPGGGQLTATLTIDIPNGLPRTETLARLVDLDEPGVLVLVVGDVGVPATWEPGELNGDPVPVSRSVCFDLLDAMAPFIAGDIPVGFLITHPNYRAIAQPSARTLQDLVRDLQTV